VFSLGSYIGFAIRAKVLLDLEPQPKTQPLRPKCK